MSAGQGAEESLGVRSRGPENGRCLGGCACLSLESGALSRAGKSRGRELSALVAA